VYELISTFHYDVQPRASGLSTIVVFPFVLIRLRLWLNDGSLEEPNYRIVYCTYVSIFAYEDRLAAFNVSISRS
jgi:hypothetical protein